MPVVLRPPFWAPRPSDDFAAAGQARGYNQNLFPAPPATQVKPFRWNYTLDDPPPWQARLSYNPNIFIAPPATSPFHNRQGYWYSEDSLWQSGPMNSLTISLPVAANQVLGLQQPLFMM